MGLSYSCMEIMASVLQPTVIKEEYPDGRIVTTKRFNPWLSSVGCLSVTVILLALLRPNETYKSINHVQEKLNL